MDIVAGGQCVEIWYNNRGDRNPDPLSAFASANYTLKPLRGF